MQIIPPKELTPFIKHYLFLESRGKDLKKLRLFSDGNTGIVFSFKSRLIAGSSINGFPAYLPNGFLYGQVTAFRDISLLSEIELIIVVFQPQGINLLLGIPADELRNNIVSAEYVFGKQSLELFEQLAGKVSIREKVVLLNDFFAKQISKRTHPNALIIEAALNFIMQNRGVISIGQLVKLTGYTERHIERMFIESIGINPKKFGNIIRLHHFLKHIKKGPREKNLTAIAYESGYADQSHLIREFKKITGVTPKIYLDKSEKLTINFIELLNPQI